MANTQLKFAGVLEGWIPSFWEEPTYKGDPTDFRLKIRVSEEAAEELRDLLTTNYESCCDWYRNQTGKRRFFDSPWIENEDGSITVRVTAKPKYGEFPFPIVDGDLEALAEDLLLREGSSVLVHTKLMPYSPKSPQGGMRIRPVAIQVLEAVTEVATDVGANTDVSQLFEKHDGFTQKKPSVKKKKTTKKSDNVPDVDPDF